MSSFNRKRHVLQCTRYAAFGQEVDQCEPSGRPLLPVGLKNSLTPFHQGLHPSLPTEREGDFAKAALPPLARFTGIDMASQRLREPVQTIIDHCLSIEFDFMSFPKSRFRWLKRAIKNRLLLQIPI